ncbi:MAG: hypothetical protein K2X27_20535 [Candidatus Obscuribacterales bacterium]|nr:hypothetical protein [Candidatus Obscuribacterales bacterium]
MDLLKNYLKETYRKIDSANSSFCGTPLTAKTRLQKRIASTVLLGKGKADDLLSDIAKEIAGQDKQR